MQIVILLQVRCKARTCDMPTCINAHAAIVP